MKRKNLSAEADPKHVPPPSPEAIARVAETGKDVSQFFTNRGRMMPPIQRVNVEFTAPTPRKSPKV
jgi:hypothetical protein